MTTYRLADIQPNPFRNIERYPIDRAKVEALKRVTANLSPRPATVGGTGTPIHKERTP